MRGRGEDSVELGDEYVVVNVGQRAAHRVGGFRLAVNSMNRGRVAQYAASQ